MRLCVLHKLLVLVLFQLTILNPARAEQNSITAIDIVRDAQQMVITVSMKQAPGQLPAGFSTVSPPRLVLDFFDTINATGQTRKQADATEQRGELRYVDIVQAGRQPHAAGVESEARAVLHDSDQTKSDHDQAGAGWRCHICCNGYGGR